MKRTTLSLCCFVICFLQAALFVQASDGAVSSKNLSVKQCQNIQGEYANYHINSAKLTNDHSQLPAFCHIEGRIEKSINFVMRMPQSGWNGKFVVAGCGGFCGEIDFDKKGMSNTINEAVKLGYATIISDSGHQAKNWQTQWAINNDSKLKLYAGAWIPKAVDTGKAVIKQLYQAKTERTYYSGCSNGGRLGFFAAQRYPDLFDGIAAGGSIMDLTGNAGIHGLWLLQTTRDKNLQPTINVKKVPLLAKTVMAQCDAIDGIKDGLIADPKQCKPDLAPLKCQGADNLQCLTQGEVTAIERLYQGATVNGKQLFAGIPAGSESLWPIWIVGTDKRWGWGEKAALGYLRLAYGIDEDKPFPIHQLTLADELANINRLAPILNATNPDISEFSKAGGKLLAYHGLSDPLILYPRIVQYAQEVTKVLGEEAQSNTARFFMVPGHGHCWEVKNKQPDSFNPVAVLDRWVETQKAPDFIDMQHVNKAGQALRERRICKYPEQAVLVGKNIDDAQAYQCQ